MRSDSPDGTCNACGDSVTRDDTIVVLGIGNVLWADEGFGVRGVEALQAGWDFAPHVRLVDGGTQGLYLLPLVQQAARLLILDAVDYGLAPGSIKLVENDEVPRFLGATKMSLHQTGFQEVLMLAQLTDAYPREVLLIGCQPEELDDYGGSLREGTKAALDEALRIAVQRLAAWGAAPRAREAPPAPAEAATPTSLTLAAYEAGRPSADTACRVGDARFIAAE
ncbi:MAG TPA: HyaD/HybD family hydrogenase maturation endopeptidase [Burkholderiaceae bacterium]|nr:HyaD/HybD family hydrogenase maturation endopeptidase [Burkholderiaceae bacterium]